MFRQSFRYGGLVIIIAPQMVCHTQIKAIFASRGNAIQSAHLCSRAFFFLSFVIAPVLLLLLATRWRERNRASLQLNTFLIWHWRALERVRRIIKLLQRRIYHRLYISKCLLARVALGEESFLFLRQFESRMGRLSFSFFIAFSLYI